LSFTFIQSSLAANEPYLFHNQHMGHPFLLPKICRTPHANIPHHAQGTQKFGGFGSGNKNMHGQMKTILRSLRRMDQFHHRSPREFMIFAPTL
jgi:hypothetical protein